MEQKIETFSDEALIQELFRRRISSNVTDMNEFEECIEKQQAFESEIQLAAYLKDLSSHEDNTPKHCPQCGVKCRVRRQKVKRIIRSCLGMAHFLRNHHYCEDCQLGFYPLDVELGLPERGELTPKMEQRVLDFGINSPFEEAAERWEVHQCWKPLRESVSPGYRARW